MTSLRRRAVQGAGNFLGWQLPSALRPTCRRQNGPFALYPFVRPRFCWSRWPRRAIVLREGTHVLANGTICIARKDAAYGDMSLLRCTNLVAVRREA